MSELGKLLIKKYESLRLHAYYDTGGKLTIGWGHTENVNEGDVITEEQAEQFFNLDIEWAEDLVTHADVHSRLNPHQFDAVVSLVYNAGLKVLSGAIGEILKLGKIDEIAGQFCLWVSDNGTILNGLLNRRCAEAYIFQVGYTPKMMKWLKEA